MKRFIGPLILVLCVAVSALWGRDVHVKGYYRKDGTYVAPYTRTSPNKTRNDNYSTRGNVNPYTGEAGTRPRDQEMRPAVRAAQDVGAQNVTTTTAKPSPPMGWLGVKSGMTWRELRRQMGVPRVVEGKGDYEVWTYPTGTVFVREGRVVAWKQIMSH